ncbi:Pre-rrna processing protein [Mycena kentingensis (nom. inval.)]|nr:Pre-rrna processing protein [Mycena kentingensis (nom. inval.)]
MDAADDVNNEKEQNEVEDEEKGDDTGDMSDAEDGPSLGEVQLPSRDDTNVPKSKLPVCKNSSNQEKRLCRRTKNISVSTRFKCDPGRDLRAAMNKIGYIERTDVPGLDSSMESHHIIDVKFFDESKRRRIHFSDEGNAASCSLQIATADASPSLITRPYQGGGRGEARDEEHAGFVLDGHALHVKFAGRGTEEERDKGAGSSKSRTTKMIVKNVPFEAKKKDIRELFSSHGSLKSVRPPKRFDSRSCGFAFFDFVSRAEAENAYAALRHTHLLGRHLVLEWAKEAEQDLEVLRKKAGVGFGTGMDSAERKADDLTEQVAVLREHSLDRLADEVATLKVVARYEVNDRVLRAYNDRILVPTPADSNLPAVTPGDLKHLKRKQLNCITELLDYAPQRPSTTPNKTERIRDKLFARLTVDELALCRLLHKQQKTDIVFPRHGLPGLHPVPDLTTAKWILDQHAPQFRDTYEALLATNPMRMQSDSSPLTDERRRLFLPEVGDFEQTPIGKKEIQIRQLMRWQPNSGSLVTSARALKSEVVDAW